MKYTPEQIEEILSKHTGFSTRAAMGIVAPVETPEGILTVEAVGLVEGVLNNCRELCLPETWEASLGNDIIINPDHSPKILDVLSFDGKASIKDHKITKEELQIAFAGADTSSAVGKKVKTFNVAFDINRNEEPKYYDIFKAGKIKHWSISSYDTYAFAANPSKIDWASKEAYDRYEAYKNRLVLPSAENIDFFYVITATNIVAISPVLFPSQRMAFTSSIAEREAADREQEQQYSLYQQLLDMTKK